MKYMEKGGFQNNPFMRLTLGLTLLFLVGFWITNFMLYFSKMSLNPQSVADYYLGSDKDFLIARTFGSMLEVTHMHLPMMAVVILLLTHLVIFAPFKDRMKYTIIFVSFFSGLFNEMSGWLVRFVGPEFGLLKVVSFLTFQAMLAFLMFSLGWYLFKNQTQVKQKH